MIDFGARVYDSRLGRFFSTDPIVYPYWSPYQYDANSPIWQKDILGMGLFEGFKKRVQEKKAKSDQTNFEANHESEFETEQLKEVVVGASRKVASTTSDVDKGGSLSFWERWKAWDKSLEGSSEGANSGSMSKTSKRVQSATFNTVVGGVGAVSSAASVEVTGPFGVAATVYCSDQFWEGLGEFKAIYTDTYDDNRIYAPLKNGIIARNPNYGLVLYNSGSIITGLHGLKTNVGALTTGSSGVSDIIGVVGGLQGLDSDVKELKN